MGRTHHRKGAAHRGGLIRGNLARATRESSSLKGPPGRVPPHCGLKRDTRAPARILHSGPLAGPAGGPQDGVGTAPAETGRSFGRENPHPTADPATINRKEGKT